MKKELLEIINNYGIDKQLKYIHSEYFELDEAIIDYKYADVMVMLKHASVSLHLPLAGC